MHCHNCGHEIQAGPALLPRVRGAPGRRLHGVRSGPAGRGPVLSGMRDADDRRALDGRSGGVDRQRWQRGRAGRRVVRAPARQRPVRRPRRLHLRRPRSATRRRPGRSSTRYFALARSVIERHGGTVEKFIGDAVMAVWGAPVAREDDAEQAVRAALELVDAASQLPGPDGPPLLRAGVLTGEAAVTLGSTGEAMVAGDLVNTASRFQSAAPPGAVLVGDATHRAASRRDHLRAVRRARAEGQASARGGVASPACRGRSRRGPPVGGARGAVRRPRRRAPAAQGPVPHDHARGAHPARVDRRAGRHRQDHASPGSSRSTSTA